MTDSDDEVRIVTEPKRPRTPNSGSKAGKKYLTTQQKQDIVRANDRGVKKSDIAKTFDTSIRTVYSVLDQYRSEGHTSGLYTYTNKFSRVFMRIAFVAWWASHLGIYCTAATTTFTYSCLMNENDYDDN
ncbi:homeodomain-like domain-containing protein [Ditylenchus destructor]|nr:homeodomain-like domain-containing protein [Ditylenchus destructor]